MSTSYVWTRLENESIPCMVYFATGSVVDNLKDAIKEKFPTLKNVNNSQLSVLYQGNVCEVDASVTGLTVGNSKNEPLIVLVAQGILSHLHIQFFTV